MANNNKDIKHLIVFVSICFILGAILLMTKPSFFIIKSSQSAVAGTLMVALAIMFIPSIGYKLGHNTR